MKTGTEPPQEAAPAIDSTGLVARLRKLLLNRQMDAEEYSVSGTDEQWGNAVQDVAALHRAIGIVDRYDEKAKLLAEIEDQSATDQAHLHRAAKRSGVRCSAGLAPENLMNKNQSE